jgi:hypothetical protein
MNELAVVNHGPNWHRLKSLVLDSVSSLITKRVYNLGLDEFFEWYGQEPRPGFTKATVAAWRVALEARGLGAVSINVRITACGNWPLRPPTTGCWRRNWPTDHPREGGRFQRPAPRELAQRQAGAGAPERAGCHQYQGAARQGDPSRSPGLWTPPIRGSRAYVQAHPAA